MKSLKIKIYPTKNQQLIKMKKTIRNNFRNEVFKRDNYKCKVCGDSTSKLDAHHITDRSLMENGGYVKENGITLCDKENGCHIKAEHYHMGLEVENGYLPNDLYKLIKSSYEIACQKSKLL